MLGNAQIVLDTLAERYWSDVGKSSTSICYLLGEFPTVSLDIIKGPSHHIRFA